MSALTKEQIQNLTPEQQEAVACVTLSEAKRRDLLFKTTKHNAWQTCLTSFIPLIVVVVFFIWHDWKIQESDRLVLLAVLLILSGAAQMQVATINLRLNTLVKLLETDLWSQKAGIDYQEADKTAHPMPPRRVADESLP
jgi:hypothetical protein